MVDAPKLPRNVLRPLRWRTAIAWGSWLLSVGVLWWQHKQNLLHPEPLVFLVLALITIFAALTGFLSGLRRAIIGPRRRAAIAWALLAISPLVIWGGLGSYASNLAKRKHIPHDAPFILMQRVGYSLMEAEARYFYPHRKESARIVMHYRDGIDYPDDDLQRMDEHVARMEEETGLRLREKIRWVRGTLLGRRYLCMYGVALGSEAGRAASVDRHELAHALMAQHESPDSRPPTIVREGWAESQSRSPSDLAMQAIAIRDLLEAPDGAPPPQVFSDTEGFERLFERIRTEGRIASYLRALTDDYWYWHDRGPVYPIGGTFAHFIIRNFGVKRFVAFYFACRPGAIDEACQRELGVDLASLEKQMWAETEKLSKEKPKDGHGY